MRPYLVSAPLRRQQSLVINSIHCRSHHHRPIYLITSHCNGAPPKDPRQSGSVPTRPELHHVAPLFGVPTWKGVLFSFSGSYLMLLIRWVERGNEMKCDLSPSKLRPTTITHSKLKLPALFLKRLGSSRAQARVGFSEHSFSSHLCALSPNRFKIPFSRCHFYFYFPFLFKLKSILYLNMYIS